MVNKAGSVWNINLIDLNQPFDKSFMVNLGCNNSTWEQMEWSSHFNH